MNIYVGNLAYSVKDAELRNAFAAFGEVVSAEVVINKHTGRSRGYGFVRMAKAEEGRAAVKALDGQELHGRAMRVDESKPETDKRSRSNEGRRSNSDARPARRVRPREAATAAPSSPPKSGGGLLGFVKDLFSRR